MSETDLSTRTTELHSRRHKVRAFAEIRAVTTQEKKQTSWKSSWWSRRTLGCFYCWVNSTSMFANSNRACSAWAWPFRNASSRPEWIKEIWLSLSFGASLFSKSISPTSWGCSRIMQSIRELKRRTNTCLGLWCHQHLKVCISTKVHQVSRLLLLKLKMESKSLTRPSWLYPRRSWTLVVAYRPTLQSFCRSTSKRSRINQ